MKPEAVKDLALQLVSDDLVARRVGANYTAEARKTILDFYAWTEAHAIGDIRTASLEQLRSYRDDLAVKLSKTSGERIKHSTVNSRFGVVRLLYACLYRAGLIEDNPAGQLGDALPAEMVCRRALTEKEMQRFLDELDTTTKQGLRDRALFELVYAAGLRVGEVAGLKVSDVDFERRIMRVRGKGDKDRLVPISEVAKDVLLLYLGERANEREAWLFTGSRGPMTGSHVRPGSVSERFGRSLGGSGWTTPS
jgi:site-specific recombinase XerD